MWQIWLIISGICFVIEIATVGFFVFWFGIGALFAWMSTNCTYKLPFWLPNTATPYHIKIKNKRR
jgi:membrane protein implicated in regulation of membrane protease activity